MDGPTITITFTGDAALKPGDVWPENVPESFTADDVALAMTSSGSKAQVLHDWLLSESVLVDVAVQVENPAYAGDDVLFGEPPPKWTTTYAEVWR